MRWDIFGLDCHWNEKKCILIEIYWSGGVLWVWQDSKRTFYYKSCWNLNIVLLCNKQLACLNDALKKNFFWGKKSFDDFATWLCYSCLCVANNTTNNSGSIIESSFSRSVPFSLSFVSLHPTSVSWLATPSSRYQ